MLKCGPEERDEERLALFDLSRAQAWLAQSCRITSAVLNHLVLLDG